MSGRLIHEWEHPEIGPIRIIDRAEDGEPPTPVVDVDDPGIYVDLEGMEDAGLLIDALGEKIASLIEERVILREKVVAMASTAAGMRSIAGTSEEYWTQDGRAEAYGDVLDLLAEPGEDRT